MGATFSVLFWLNKSKQRKTTLKMPIFVRITVNGKRAELSTGKTIAPDNWEPVWGRVKGNTEEAKTLNCYLDKINVRLTRIFEDMADNGQSISAQEIKNRFLGKETRKHSLIDLFETHNKQMKSQIDNGYSEGTLERYETTLKHLRGYLSMIHKKNDIYVEDLNYSFMADFDVYLRAEKSIGHNTSVKYLRNFKKIVLLALKNEWINRDPFIRFKLALNDVNKEYLTKEEVQKLRDKNFEIDRLDHVKDIFVFCCYTGLAYADVEKLTGKEIKKGLDGEMWVMVNRKKTGIQSHIPLLPEAAAILNKYQNNPTNANNGNLLPVVSNQKMNAYLKEIGDVCGINKNITFHMARHTFATTITLSNGVSMETVGSMLGHKNLKTTQIYAKVVQEKVSREMKQLKAILQI
jgi:site-specific recombinase XerD